MAWVRSDFWLSLS